MMEKGPGGRTGGEKSRGENQMGARRKFENDTSWSKGGGGGNGLPTKRDRGAALERGWRRWRMTRLKLVAARREMMRFCSDF